MKRRFQSRKELVEYSDREEALIRKLWGGGLSAALVAVQINLEFGNERSRNAIIGKAGRMGCPRRESPIQMGQLRGSDRYRKREKRKVAEKALVVEPIFDEPELEDKIVSSVEIKSKSSHSFKDCQFIFGSVPRYPAEPDWCVEAALYREVYCEKHFELTRRALPAKKKHGGGGFNSNPMRRRIQPPIAG